jgi:hypothetical protein
LLSLLLLLPLQLSPLLVPPLLLPVVPVGLPQPLLSLLPQLPMLLPLLLLVRGSSWLPCKRWATWVPLCSAPASLLLLLLRTSPHHRDNHPHQHPVPLLPWQTHVACAAPNLLP